MEEKQDYIFYSFGLALFAVPLIKIPHFGMYFSALTCLYYFGVFGALLLYHHLPSVNIHLSPLDSLDQLVGQWLILAHSQGLFSKVSYLLLGRIFKEATLLPLRLLLSFRKACLNI